MAERGDVITTPPGVPHMWWNEGDQPAQLIVEFRPAMKTESLFEEIFRLAHEGKSGPTGIPRPLRLAVVLREHEDEFYPAGLPVPPVPILKIAVAIGASIGRVLGYGASSRARR